MSIRTRLAVQFVMLASLVLGVSFLAVYLRSTDFRREEFVNRLRDHGESAAKLLIQVDEVDDRLLRKMEEFSPVRMPEEAISIYGNDDSLVFHLGREQRPQGVAQAFLDSIRNKGQFVANYGERELCGFVFKDHDDSFVVLASAQDIYGRRKLRDQARVMLVTFLAGLVLTYLIGRFFAERALSPLQRLVEELRGIGASDLSKRIRLGNETDELAQVASSFNDLLARLQAAFSTQKNFIANASHEMRTPLTAISGQIDVLLLKPRNILEYSTALRSVQEDLRAVNRLTDRLLLMAQAESGATTLTFKPVRMDEVVWAARMEVLRANPDASVKVAINEVEDERDITVKGNEVLLRSMVLNLVDNACKYSLDHEATVLLKGTGTGVVLEVLDQGPGIDPKDQGRIFEHFFRSGNPTGAKGHGIGLALVKRIVEQHGATIELRSALGAGARFIITLQRADRSI